MMATFDAMESPSVPANQFGLSTAIWPELTKEQHQARAEMLKQEQLQRYNSTKNSIQAWEAKFESLYGRKPQFCDIEPDYGTHNGSSPQSFLSPALPEQSFLLAFLSQNPLKY